MREISYWGDLPDMLDKGFLAINVTNNTSDKYRQNTDFKKLKKTGFWCLPKEMLKEPVYGKIVLLYFLEPDENKYYLYRGVVDRVELDEAEKGKVKPVAVEKGRRRYIIHVSRKGWVCIGESKEKFSTFFSGLKIGSSPVCVWVRPSDGQTIFEKIAGDIKDIKKSAISKTEVKRLVDARLGQGLFREEILSLWNRSCAATKVTLKDILRASHIRPWRDSNNQERLDPYNGLPLVANLDALFDRFLITFDDEGVLYVSPSIHKEIRSLNLPQRLWRCPDHRTQVYLADHRKSCGFSSEWRCVKDL